MATKTPEQTEAEKLAKQTAEESQAAGEKPKTDSQDETLSVGTQEVDAAKEVSSTNAPKVPKSLPEKATYKVSEPPAPATVWTFKGRALKAGEEIELEKADAEDAIKRGLISPP